MFAEKNMPKGGDPHSDSGEGGKISEWQAAWNVTNAIQVPYLAIHVAYLAIQVPYLAIHVAYLAI